MISAGELKQRALVEGLEDHLGLWWLIGYFQDLPDSADRRRETLKFVEQLLGSGWFEPGFPTSDGVGFEAWKLSPEESLDRIGREWDELGHEPNIGDVVWLNLTRAGVSEARKHVVRA
jgi:hypothetical protein